MIKLNILILIIIPSGGKSKGKNEFKIEPFRGEYNLAFGDMMSRPMIAKPVSLVYLPRPRSG